MLAHLGLLQVLLSCALLLFEAVTCVSWSGLDCGLAVEVYWCVVDSITVTGIEITIYVEIC